MNEILIANKWNKTTNPPPTPGHTKKHPEGYLTCRLKRVLLKIYRCQDPETKEIKKIEGAKGLMQVLVWEGLQGNVKAIKEILDRIDGTTTQQFQHTGEVSHKHFLEDIIKKAQNNDRSASEVPARFN